MIIEFPKYDFPSRLFNFNDNYEIVFDNYRSLEGHIRNQLRSEDYSQIRDGLSNVLYWGYYRIGYGETRIKLFRDKVTEFQLQSFKILLKNNAANPINIKNIGMPQFSGFSFISKILMFLDPTKNVVLDKKIMELKDPMNPDNPLSKIPYCAERDTGIRITNVSQEYYRKWCELCGFIANQLDDKHIAVDIERGFFKLVEAGKLNYGRQIIANYVR